MVVVSRPGFVAGFADAIPQPAHGICPGSSGELHLVHGVGFAEELATVAAVDGGGTGFGAERVGTNVVGWGQGALPVGFGDDVLGV